jgi:hypothetical protein
MMYTDDEATNERQRNYAAEEGCRNPFFLNIRRKAKKMDARFGRLVRVFGYNHYTWMG